ncbi:MAG TPA: hypothetical protein VH062_30235 [Polyangiaceae bacterium]|jgi:hypothetical protein|nr:hypothetical protein [Polyangiaceae bacterium]
MTEQPPETEAVRLRREVVSARRSFIIIFGVGIIGAITSVVLILKNRPEGNFGNGYGAPVPSFTPHVAMKTCQKFGEPCEFAPNKLGACIEKEGCTGANCLFCQSQH